MAHPYAGHKQNAVGKRRVKLLMQSGGYINGKTKPTKPDPVTGLCPGEPDADDATATSEMPDVEGEKCGGRLDKRARGGAKTRANGGGIGAFHKITPSKRKPHMNVNIVNISRPGGPRRPPGMPAMPMGGGAGLPAMPAMGPRMPGMPGMARGGRMRTGKNYGQGSGEGRLEEFKHMKGR